MEKERVSFELRQDDVMESIALYVRDDKINRALNELRRVDKSNLAIIQDTIKILEEGFVVSNKEFVDKSFADLATPLTPDPKIHTAGLCQPIGEPAIPNTIKEGKVVLPKIEIACTDEDLIKSMQGNMFKSGMF